MGKEEETEVQPAGQSDSDSDSDSDEALPASDQPTCAAALPSSDAPLFFPRLCIPPSAVLNYMYPKADTVHGVRRKSTSAAGRAPS